MNGAKNFALQRIKFISVYKFDSELSEREQT